MIAFQYDGDFNWLEKRIEAFENLSYEEFTAYAEEFLGKKNTRRLAICVNGQLPEGEQIRYRATDLDQLRSEISYEGRDVILKN